MCEFPDVMTDIETGGVDPSRGQVLQIAAVRFNAAKRTIDHRFFDQCLLAQPNRMWEEGTREFWMRRRDVLTKIQARMQDPKEVLVNFLGWTEYQPLTFWGKPTHFDFSFLQSLYKDYGMQIPFHYRTANDLNSFARGRYWPEVPPVWEKILPFAGEEHNALHDCLHQIGVLFAILDKREVPGES